jgi:hypothetical protein
MRLEFRARLLAPPDITIARRVAAGGEPEGFDCCFQSIGGHQQDVIDDQGITFRQP